MGAWGAIAQAGMDLTKEFMQNNRQEDQQDFNAEQAIMQRDWETAMYRNRYRYQTEDMMGAGLNPMLSYMQAPPGPPSGHAASSGIAGSAGSSNIGSVINSAMQADRDSAQAELMKAEAGKAKAETAEVEERTPTHAVSREVMTQQIEESKTKIEGILQTVKVGVASAANIEQQTRNLQELIPQIKATVDNLKAHTKLAGAQEASARADVPLKGAQTSHAAAEAGTSMARTGEINQRVAANLPALEAALGDLERIQRNLAIPGHLNQANAQETYAGALGAALRALNPLTDAVTGAAAGYAVGSSRNKPDHVDPNKARKAWRK